MSAALSVFSWHSPFPSRLGGSATDVLITDRCHGPGSDTHPTAAQSLGFLKKAATELALLGQLQFLRSVSPYARFFIVLGKEGTFSILVPGGPTHL